jgi:hypothetical protein
LLPVSLQIGRISGYIQYLVSGKENPVSWPDTGTGYQKRPDYPAGPIVGASLANLTVPYELNNLQNLYILSKV